MNKIKLHKVVRTVLIVVVSLIVIALLMHLTVNYLVPFIVKMHSSNGAY